MRRNDDHNPDCKNLVRHKSECPYEMPFKPFLWCSSCQAKAGIISMAQQHKVMVVNET